MEEKLKVSTSQTETVEAGVSPARTQSGADASQASKTRSNEENKSATEDSSGGKFKTELALDLNELQESSSEQLEALARDLDVYLHPARSRHQHLLDIVRAALATGAPVTAEGFLDQVADSFALLRGPKLNFLPVPEDVAVSRALIEQHHLRPGQKVAGTVRLPVQREKILSLDKVTYLEGQPGAEWSEPTQLDKRSPLFPQRRSL